ncbi:hypothetical protein BGX23_011757 [Mortierella sp. AD031]|nr:hypothetical protein BGX23_011757 [Mortierella sp. AD031]
MVKLTISALLLVQLCILHAHASHYISFRKGKYEAFTDRAGICLHNGNRILMTYQDDFAKNVQNYGYHKDGWFANVNWHNKEVDVQGWGRYKFQQVRFQSFRVTADGC